MPTSTNTIRASNGVTIASRVLADLTAKPEPSPAAFSAPDKAEWTELDPATLTPALRAAYAAYTDQRRIAAAAKSAFETAMSAAASVPPGARLVFGYNFGKLSIAIVADDAKGKRTSKQAQSLSDFLASAKLTGART
jgi:hypothetical protein